MTDLLRPGGVISPAGRLTVEDVADLAAEWRRRYAVTSGATRLVNRSYWVDITSYADPDPQHLWIGPGWDPRSPAPIHGPEIPDLMTALAQCWWQARHELGLD